MDAPRAYRYRCALITGASSGLGAEFARQLAPDCEAIILVARRGDLMKQLASELGVSSPATEVQCVTTDLSDGKDREGLFEMLQAMALTPDLLINNAGILSSEPLSDLDL